MSTLDEWQKARRSGLRSKDQELIDEMVGRSDPVEKVEFEMSDKKFISKLESMDRAISMMYSDQKSIAEALRKRILISSCLHVITWSLLIAMIVSGDRAKSLAGLDEFRNINAATIASFFKTPLKAGEKRRARITYKNTCKGDKPEISSREVNLF